MPKLREVCRQIRSKNAGPYWITVDLFFHDRDALERYGEASSLATAAIGRIVGCEAERIKRFVVPNLAVLKFSYPRPLPQGGVMERDMHGGQQYVRLLDLEV